MMALLEHDVFLPQKINSLFRGVHACSFDDAPDTVATKYAKMIVCGPDAKDVLEFLARGIYLCKFRTEDFEDNFGIKFFKAFDQAMWRPLRHSEKNNFINALVMTDEVARYCIYSLGGAVSNKLYYDISIRYLRSGGDRVLSAQIFRAMFWRRAAELDTIYAELRRCSRARPDDAEYLVRLIFPHADEHDIRNFVNGGEPKFDIANCVPDENEFWTYYSL